VWGIVRVRHGSATLPSAVSANRRKEILSETRVLIKTHFTSRIIDTRPSVPDAIGKLGVNADAGRRSTTRRATSNGQLLRPSRLRTCDRLTYRAVAPAQNIFLAFSTNSIVLYIRPSSR
jgi:hypothetical protein